MTNITPDSHLDPTAEISLENVKKRAIKGIAVLTGRTVILNLISFVSQGLLWAFIEPSEFGIFLLVSAAVNFLSYFADIGLGAALIQKKEKPNQEDYKTVFFVQEILVLLIVALVFIASPILARTHNLDNEAMNLLYALNISFFLASLKNIPSIMLERKMEFGKFIIPQVFENLVYSVTLVYFAYRGFGITSFTYSVLLRGIVGVIAIYLLQPWRPAFGISTSSLKALLKYGVPYQLNSFLATVKDDGITILTGGILGSGGLGILGTAQKLSQYPLRFFMDNVNKVTFPAFSRMQDNKNDLSRLLTRSIFFISSLVFPSLAGLAILFPVLIEVIPRYQKWEPAYLPLLLLSINSFWAAPTTQLTNVLASIGKIKVNLQLMVMWTLLTWATVPLFSKMWGLNGASVAYALVGTSSIVAFFLVKKEVAWSISNSLGPPLAASLIMGACIFAVRNLVGSFSLLGLILLVLIGAVIYMAALRVIVGESLMSDVKKIFSEFRKK